MATPAHPRRTRVARQRGWLRAAAITLGTLLGLLVALLLLVRDRIVFPD